METKTSTIERIESVLEAITGTTVGTLDMKGDIRSQLALNSMQFVQLFTALEMEFEVELPLSIMNVRTVGDFVTIIEGAAEQA